MRYKLEIVVNGYSGRTARVFDGRENRIICDCDTIQDAKNIAKAMNVSNSWEPILTTNEMEKE